MDSRSLKQPRGYVGAVAVIVAGLAIAASVAYADEPGSRFGPWRLGMAREQVVSFAEYGPYADVAVTGGVETPHGRRAMGDDGYVSFMFDPTERLSHIRVWMYEGNDLEAALAQFESLLKSFETDHGGLAPPAEIAMRAELRSGPVRDLLEDALRNADDGETVISSGILAKEQPNDQDIAILLTYMSAHDWYGVFLIAEPKSARMLPTWEMQTQADVLRKLCGELSREQREKSLNCSGWAPQ